MSRFLSARFAGLEAYTPGEQPQDMQYVKLNTNESPYPPSPEVFARINGDEIGKLQLYPDPEGKILRQKLADLYGVTAENIFLSNGSDDILNFAFMAFCDETHGAMFPEISYGFYPVYADLYGVQAKQVPLQADFTISAADYCKDEARWSSLPIQTRLRGWNCLRTTSKKSSSQIPITWSSSTRHILILVVPAVWI